MLTLIFNIIKKEITIMKKVVSILLAALLVFGLVACGESAETTKAAGDATAVQTVEEGKLIMVTNAAFPPYEFVGDDGEFAGIDVEVAGLIAKELGLELEIQDMEFASLLTAVQSGKADVVLAGLTVTDERKQNVDFSTSYAKGVQSVIVKEGSDIKTLDDITGHKIGVQEATTGDIYASDTPENGGFGEENVIRYSKGADAVQALIAGKVDCVIIDNNPAKEYVKANAGLTILDTAFTEEDYAIATSKGNTELLNQINDILAKKTADGTIQGILDKYIPSK